jgi:hypothetical protein
MVGAMIRPTLIRQSVTPTLSSRNDATPPMTMPPGNQTWNWFSFFVFSSG